ncbi:hypothetical protein [Bacillus sp. KH172YL63]|uniref:hypothetical protein n=1 Tax=Bacillus sp. KH172YL63 TaxID=2709784 RepID=UPI0013E520C1|nr:hypothetical protein [Bacillus sp. KH172YL63]BCB03237.1 hypothetical protein KH172YL63_13700 [Bacillus sp. KH172YL63]
MKRFLFTFMLGMVLVSASILIFQWMGFSTESAVDKGTVAVDQSYSIIHKADTFQISQTLRFSSAVPDRMTITWPVGAEGYSCINQSEDNCLTKENGEFLITNISGAEETVTLTYSLKVPVENGRLLLTDWFPVLSSLITEKTDIQIIEKNVREGRWVAGYPSFHHKKLDYIDYYFFDGEGGPSDLIWLTGEWEEHETEAGRILFPHSDTADLEGLEALKSSGGYVTVVRSNELTPHSSPHLIIVKNMDETAIADVKESLIYQSYTSKDEEGWMKEFIAGLLLNRPPATGKASWAYKEIREALTPSQMDVFRREVERQKVRTVDGVKLDEWVEDVTGFHSSFFREGLNSGGPLTLAADKSIIVSDRPVELSYILYKQKKFIQFPQALKALGMDYEELETGVYFMSMDGNTFRFYVDEDYFIYNEENYGLLVKPVQKIGDAIYMDVHWFEKLFKVKVIEKEKSIEVTRQT